jgi:hypothetical protein
MHTHRAQLFHQFSSFCFEHVVFLYLALLDWKFPQPASRALTLALVVYHCHVVSPLMPAEISGWWLRVWSVDRAFVFSRHGYQQC